MTFNPRTSEIFHISLLQATGLVNPCGVFVIASKARFCIINARAEVGDNKSGDHLASRIPEAPL